MPIVLKYLITSAIVVLISEVAKRSDKLGALIAALPVVTTIAMIWMAVELKGQEQIDKIGNHAWYTFWYVIPTLPMFLAVPWMLKRGIHFGWVLLAYLLGTSLLVIALHMVTKRFGIPLL